MIKEVTINNFRGIEELKIQLKSINLFIGSNGTGKSSILDAIALAASSPSYVDGIGVNILEKVITRRGTPYHANLQHLIRVGADNASITIVEDSTNTIEICNKDTIDSKKREYRDEYKLNDLDAQARTYIGNILAAKYLSTLMNLLGGITQQRMISQQLISHEEAITYIFNKNQRHAVRLSIYDNHVVIIPQITPSTTRLTLIDNHVRFSEDIYGYLHELMLRYPNIYKNIMGFLKHKEIEDIRFNRAGDIVIKRVGDEHYIPINVIGDGTRLLLIDALVLNLPNVDIILLEEPENYMHPEYILKVVRSIIEASKNYKKQFLITTHNIDIIDYMIEDAEGSGIEKDIQIVMLYRDENGRISLEYYNYDDANEIKEALVDIRFM